MFYLVRFSGWPALSGDWRSSGCAKGVRAYFPCRVQSPVISVAGAIRSPGARPRNPMGAKTSRLDMEANSLAILVAAWVTYAASQQADNDCFQAFLLQHTSSTAAQVGAGMLGLPFYDHMSIMAVFREFVQNSGRWPVEVIDRVRNIPRAVDLYVNPFINSVAGLKRQFMAAQSDAEFMDVVEKFKITLNQTNYMQLLEVHVHSVKALIVFVVYSAAASRQPGATVFVATRWLHAALTLRRYVDYLLLQSRLHRSTDIKSVNAFFRGVVPTQLDTENGIYPWSTDMDYTGIGLWEQFRARFNAFCHPHWRAHQMVATGGCGPITLVFACTVCGVFPEHPLHHDWLGFDGCTYNTICFEKSECVSILQKVISSPHSAHAYVASSQSDTLHQQLSYFITRPAMVASSLVDWSHLPTERMLDVTDIAMFLARVLSMKIQVWYLVASLAGTVPSMLVKFPNPTVPAEGSEWEDWPVKEGFAIVFMQGVHTGHISFAVPPDV